MFRSSRRGGLLGSILGVTCYLSSLAVFCLALFGGGNLPLGGARASVQDLDAIKAQLQSEVTAALRANRDTIARQGRRIAAMRQQLEQGFETVRTVTVTSTSRGYWLIEPKLMLAVHNLTGSDLRVRFADRFELIRIAERKEFRVDDCLCFLILTRSTRSEAEFQFGCEQVREEQMATL